MKIQTILVSGLLLGSAPLFASTFAQEGQDGPSVLHPYSPAEDEPSGLERVQTMEAPPATARGFLGVALRFEVDSDGPAVAVQGVEGGTAASRVGLRAGDRIVRIDGERPESVQDAIDKIGSHRAGETIRLEIDRDGESFGLEVELGVHPEDASAWNEAEGERHEALGSEWRSAVEELLERQAAEREEWFELWERQRAELDEQLQKNRQRWEERLEALEQQPGADRGAFQDSLRQYLEQGHEARRAQLEGFHESLRHQEEQREQALRRWIDGLEDGRWQSYWPGRSSAWQEALGDEIWSQPGVWSRQQDGRGWQRMNTYTPNHPLWQRSQRTTPETRWWGGQNAQDTRIQELKELRAELDALRGELGELRSHLERTHDR